MSGEDKGKVKVHRFNRVWGEKVRILIDGFGETPAIAEFGVYDERR
jgi:alpha-L-fucosidase